MPTRIVLPTNDLAFKKIFTDIEHADIIAAFINDFTDLNVTPNQIRILNPYSIKTYQQQIAEKVRDYPDLQTGDLRWIAHDAVIAIIETADVTIEMQLAPDAEFLKRAHYYLADVYAANYNHQPTTESRFKPLKPVWSINILGYRLFDDDLAYRTTTNYVDQTHLPLEPPLFRFGFFELTKPTTDPRLAAWQRFFTTGLVATDAPPYLRRAATIIEYHNLLPEERKMIDAAEKALAIWESTLYTAKLAAEAEGIALGEARGIELGEARGIELGEARGIELGESKEAHRIAKAMLQDGLDTELIARFTNLPIAEIRQLA